MKPLKGGAEAQPFLDEQHGVVYKFFNLRADGGLGKKLALTQDTSGEWDLHIQDATLLETMEKLSVLHNAGAHPTEILGLIDTGDHLLVKQPQAALIDVGPAERAAAASRLSTTQMPADAVRGELRLFWHVDRAWLLGDLHRGNIMQDETGIPTIIDALIGTIPSKFATEVLGVRWAIEESRQRAEGQSGAQMDLL